MHMWAGGDSMWFPQAGFVGDLCTVSDCSHSCLVLGFSGMFSGGTVSKAMESQLQNASLLRL